ncbi:metallophosphoesterase [Xylophilus sp. ASV27]|uniref:metallophosphoesterase n=1 Tax=Xylophilus sp. ASV27 TaxID=2795129 RepID=UPI0018EA7FE5|nr:metallophosphoesterase [Xylophilus sp. ASV27]
MKIQLLSDLHLEVQPAFSCPPAPGADLLVLAGDVGSHHVGSLLEGSDFGLARYSPRPEYGAWPCPVLYVPGNHEYDGQDVDAARERLKALCAELGILWLERETRVLQGVRFVGTTLWSDFDALVPPRATPGQALSARGKAIRAANFYLQKTGTTRHGEPWLAEGMREEALACQDWLRGALAAPFDGPTVAVTHFAPSLASADPRYGLTPGTAGFCNALDELLPQAQLWLHGHLHCAFDYRKDGCRVVANPLGYAGKGEQAGFRPGLLIDIG